MQHLSACPAEIVVTSEQALRLIPGCIATWMDPAFHGSMYSSIRCKVGTVHANVVSAPKCVAGHAATPMNW